jgi:uncharacterized protein YodC (DUF2158 family)
MAINLQKFQRAQLVKLKGQPNSPELTITKIIRIQDENFEEKMLKFSYECTWWDSKKKCFHQLIFEENTLEKVKGCPKINRNPDFRGL